MKNKYILILLLTLLLLPINVLGLDIKSTNAIAYNIEENKVLYEKEGDTKVYVGNLTKIASTIVSLEKVENLDDKVTINSTLYSKLKGASLAGFKNKQVVTYKDLVYGSILPSGADAITNLAFNTFGSVDECVKAMNELVTKLKLTNTHFSNVTGLDDKDNYSTASDMLEILKYALKNETFKKAYETKEYKTSDSKLTLKSTIYKFYNELPYVLGSKTGTTTKSGYSISTIGGNEESNYLVITIHATSERQRIDDIKAIYSHLFDTYKYYTVVKKGDILTNISVKYSKEENVDIKSDKDYKLFLKSDDITKIKYEYKPIVEDVTYFSKDAEIGTYKVIIDDEVLLEIPVKFINKVSLDKVGILKKIIFLPIVLVILLVLAIIYKRKSNNGEVMGIEPLQVGTLKANCYILTIGNDCIIIDPGAEYKKIMDKIKDYNLRAILVTHEHSDHIGCVKKIVKTKKCKLFYKPNLNEKEYKVGPFDFEVLFTPGHSKESVTYYFRNENIMFVGDFIFKGSIGRMDLEGGSAKEMRNSIYEILKYPDNTILYPGHGSSTILGIEKENNTYLRGDF